MTLVHSKEQPKLIELAQHMRPSNAPIRFEFRPLWPNGQLRLEKLAAMGKLASTVAHEVNNPLEAGIGLWVTKELVEKNGGRITAASTQAGIASSRSHTQFRIEFPVVA